MAVSVGLPLGQSTFGPASHSLARDLRRKTQKLRSLQYKEIVDACILGEENVFAIGDVFEAIEGDWNKLDLLSVRTKGALEVPWYQIASTLWLSGGDDILKATLSKRALAHFANVALYSTDATRARISLTIFETLSVNQNKDSRKKDEVERIDRTILGQAKKGLRPVDVHVGDLYRANGKIGFLIGQEDSATKKKSSEGKADRARANSDENSSSDSSDDSDINDADSEIDMRETVIDPRGYKGRFRGISFETFEEELVEQEEIEVVLSNVENVKIQLILLLALRSGSREACAFAAAILSEERFPSAELLAEVCPRLFERYSNNILEAICMFTCIGNSDLAQEILARYLLSTKKWISDQVVCSRLGLEGKPPSINATFVPLSSFKRPIPRDNLVGRRVKVQKDGRLLEVTVKHYDKHKDMLTVEAATIPRFICRSISEIRVGPGTLFELASNGLDVIKTVGARQALFGPEAQQEEAPSIMSFSDDSFVAKPSSIAHLDDSDILVDAKAEETSGSSTPPLQSLGAKKAISSPSPNKNERRQNNESSSSQSSIIVQAKPVPSIALSPVVASFTKSTAARLDDTPRSVKSSPVKAFRSNFPTNNSQSPSRPKSTSKPSTPSTGSKQPLGKSQPSITAFFERPSSASLSRMRTMDSTSSSARKTAAPLVIDLVDSDDEDKIQYKPKALKRTFDNPEVICLDD